MKIKRCYDTIVGASVGENQLVQSGATSVTVQSGHKYYAKINGTESLGASTGSAITINDSAKDMVVDLTQMLGSAIADYVYSLGSTNGIAKLRSWGFLRGYQAYNAGSIDSVEVTEKKVVGFNQWNEEWEVGTYASATGGKVYVSNRIRSKNAIRVFPNTTYYITGGVNSSNPNTLYFYDSSGAYLGVSYQQSKYNAEFTTPANAHYLRFNTGTGYGEVYKHDICINLSNPDRNGEYEAYVSQSYDYGDDTLRGIFKLDANNNLYADGDVKSADGTITRRYGTRAYQSGDESLADAITDGTTTVYKLTTPTTEQGDPFPTPQVCYPDGTEEYLTGNGVPVGHESKYQL